MILMDTNQVMLATLLYSLGNHTNTELELGLVRHMVLNSLRANNLKFRNKYGKMVVISDSKRYWRKEYFPYYKASRKKKREESEIDWPMLFRYMETIKTEIQTYFPYKYMCVDGAEADDIIATLCRDVQEPTLILSGDKDFLQLHRNNIEQYNPVRDLFLEPINPEQTLFEHIIRGDFGDGIPNVASPDNCIVLGERQKPITKKLLASLSNIANEPDSPYYRNYMRNKTLIDLTMIPSELVQSIKEEFKTKAEQDRSKLMGYFAQNKLREHLKNINDF